MPYSVQGKLQTSCLERRVFHTKNNKQIVVVLTDPCAEDNGGCSQVCAVDNHKVVCECNDGYNVDPLDSANCNGECKQKNAIFVCNNNFNSANNTTR